MTKMAKIDTPSIIKAAENRTLWGRTYLRNPHEGVFPGSATHGKQCLPYRTSMIKHCNKQLTLLYLQTTSDVCKSLPRKHILV